MLVFLAGVAVAPLPCIFICSRIFCTLDKRKKYYFAVDMKTEQLTHQLLRAIATASDMPAFRRLHQRYSGKMASFAEVYVKSPDLADEVVSDVFLKIWQNRVGLLQVQNFEAYLFTAVRNQSIKYISREQRHLHLLQLDEIYTAEPQEAPSADPYEQLLGKELAARLERAILQLPRQCQAVYRLVKENGLKYREVAEVLDVSPNTVENQMVKAMKIIRQEMANWLEDQPSTKKFRSKHAIISISGLVLVFFQFFFKTG